MSEREEAVPVQKENKAPTLGQELGNTSSSAGLTQRRVLKMVQVGGQVYLGYLEGSNLKDAVQVNTGYVAQELRSDTVESYLIHQELGKLTSMNIGSVDTISHRDLNPDELHLMEEVNFKFDRAKKTAMSQLVVQTFKESLGK